MARAGDADVTGAPSGHLHRKRTTLNARSTNRLAEPALQLLRQHLQTVPFPVGVAETHGQHKVAEAICNEGLCARGLLDINEAANPLADQRHGQAMARLRAPGGASLQ